jgi:predicted lysophospholipase L1 biosynthesis ABC-type transport system permease subunit
MEKQLEDLKAIREMIEKSSKFLSLSGLSGVMAGVTAIAGAAIAYFFIFGQSRAVAVPMLIIDALLILLISIGFGILFSARKAKKHKLKLVNSVTLKIVYNLAIPLATGGILSLIMIYRDQIELVAAITLIFYGLGLINASKYTLDEIHYLGITEIVLGIGAALFLYHGIIFWTIGFGLCHIVYGLIMYKKYDLKK